MGIGIKDEGSNGRRVIVFADRRVLGGTADECCSASMHHGSIRLPLEWAGYRQSGPQEDTDDGPMVFDQGEFDRILTELSLPNPDERFIVAVVEDGRARPPKVMWHYVKADRKHLVPFLMGLSERKLGSFAMVRDFSVGTGRVVEPMVLAALLLCVTAALYVIFQNIGTHIPFLVIIPILAGMHALIHRYRDWDGVVPEYVGTLRNAQILSVVPGMGLLYLRCMRSLLYLIPALAILLAVALEITGIASYDVSPEDLWTIHAAELIWWVCLMMLSMLDAAGVCRAREMEPGFFWFSSELWNPTAISITVLALGVIVSIFCRFRSDLGMFVWIPVAAMVVLYHLTHRGDTN